MCEMIALHHFEENIFAHGHTVDLHLRALKIFPRPCVSLYCSPTTMRTWHRCIVIDLLNLLTESQRLNAHWPEEIRV